MSAPSEPGGPHQLVRIHMETESAPLSFSMPPSHGAPSLAAPVHGPSLPRFPLLPISVDCNALENLFQEQEADSSRIFSLMREPFLKLQKDT